jgi:predicted lipoprotein with Yx(FWY)xxD motif
MKTLYHYSRVVFSLLFGAYLLLACDKDKNEDAAPAPAIQLTNTSLGNVMTDERGMTLYFFANDFDGKSACTGNCLSAWPVFYRENPALATGLNAADFTIITRADGTKQTAYKGWPLYYYAQDKKSGDVTGENVNKVWFVAKPDYTIMMSSAQLVGNNGKSYTSQYAEGTGVTAYFVDSKGVTLYAFKPDKFNTNTYTKSDFSNNATWPLFEESLKEVPSVLNKADFGSITVFGRNQLTYKGWPLYYFGPDNNQRGNNKGVSVPQPGVWPIVNLDTQTAPK